MDLTINYSSFSSEQIISCDSAVWNGNTYNTSGIYVDTLQTIHGCDSVASLYLTVNYSNFTLDTLEACDSAIWNGNTYNSSGNYTDTLQTSSGCDSVVTLLSLIHI